MCTLLILGRGELIIPATERERRNDLMKLGFVCIFRYNYDIVKDVPLEGKYQWVRLLP